MHCGLDLAHVLGVKHPYRSPLGPKQEVATLAPNHPYSPPSLSILAQPTFTSSLLPTMTLVLLYWLLGEAVLSTRYNLVGPGLPDQKPSRSILAAHLTLQKKSAP